MARNRSIAVILRAEVGQYTRAMAEAAKASEKVGKDADKAAKEAARAQAEQKKQAQELVNSYQQLGGPLMAIGGAMTAITAATLKAGISYNTLQQQSRAAMTTLLGSSQAANAQMDQLDEFARTSPFAKQTFITAQQQMLAFGIETQKVVPYLDAIQDAVAAAGGNTQMVGELAFIMAQISSASKITGQDLIQFGQRGVNAAELIGSQMDMTGAQVRQAITAGTLDADKALDALAAGMNQKFDGAAENVKNTFTGALDRVAAAWRDFSSTMAEPFVGSEGGGIAVAGLNQIADMMRSFQKLPDWLQLVAGGTFAIAGAATLAAGAYLTLAPRIYATSVALEKLAASGSRSASMMLGSKGLAKGLGLAAGAFVAYTIAAETGVFATENFAASADEVVRILAGLEGGSLNDVFTSSTEAKSWTTALPIIGGWASAAATEISGLDDAFKALSGTSKTLGAVQTAGGLFGDSRTDLALAQFEKADAALTKLYGEGRMDEAARWHDQIAAAAERQGWELKDLADLLPSYTSALTDADLASQKAAGGLESYLDKLGMTEDELGSFVNSAAEAAAGWVGIGDSVADASVSLGDWIKQMEDQAQALRDFEANAARAGKDGLDQGLIQSLRELGPEGAFRMKQLADASEEEIARANAAWRDQSAVVDESKQAVIDYLAEISDIPAEVITKIMAEDKTGGVIDTVRNRFIDLARGINIPIRTHPIAQANGGITQYADGGISSTGSIVPRVPQMRHAGQGAVLWSEPETNWEAYISGKHGMESRNRQIWLLAGQKLGMLSAAASGGMAGGPSTVTVASRGTTASSAPSHFTGNLYLDSGELLGRVTGLAINAAEQTLSNQQRFDRSQSSAWR